MPHCILEYSDNILEKPNHARVLSQLNATLSETGLFELNDIKSRMIAHHAYYVGDGNPRRAFVTLNVEILSGRSEETRQMLAERCLKLLETFFRESIDSLLFSLTVQIKEIDKPSYQRIKTY